MHVATLVPADVYSALSDATRIRMMRLMAVTQEESCLCEMADSLEEPEYKLSRHLKILRASGLLTAEKEGRWIYHRLVSGNPFLDLLYDSLRCLPATDQSFREDISRFRKRIRIRSDGRCRTDSNVPSGRKERGKRPTVKAGNTK